MAIEHWLCGLHEHQAKQHNYNKKMAQLSSALEQDEGLKRAREREETLIKMPAAAAAAAASIATIGLLFIVGSAAAAVG